MGLRAHRGIRDSKGSRVMVELRATRDGRGQEFKAHKDDRAYKGKGIRGFKVHRGWMGHKVIKEDKEYRERDSKAVKDHKLQMETRDHKETKGSKEFRDPKVMAEPKDSREDKVLTELKEIREDKEFKEKAIKGCKVRKE